MIAWLKKIISGEQRDPLAPCTHEWSRSYDYTTYSGVVDSYCLKCGVTASGGGQ